jgi:hypothetical protein
MKHYVWRLALVFLLAGLTAAGLSADTLLLRDGRRVDGVLLSVRDGTVEFQERGGRRRVLRLQRDEVRSIELDSFSGDVSSDNDTGSTRPRGLREREVVVQANVAWVDTGIEVRSGQRVYFEAVGQVRWGSDRRDGPGGEERSPYNAGRPMPRRPAAALIGKVGESSNDLFFIGDDRGPIRLQNSGRLYLGINDDVLTDNRGNFRVLVFY